MFIICIVESERPHKQKQKLNDLNGDTQKHFNSELVVKFGV